MKTQPMEWRVIAKHYGLNASQENNVTHYALDVNGIGITSLGVEVCYEMAGRATASRSAFPAGWIIRYPDGRSSATRFQTAEKAMSVAETYLKRKLRLAIRHLTAEVARAWPKDHSSAFRA